MLLRIRIQRIKLVILLVLMLGFGFLFARGQSGNPDLVAGRGTPSERVGGDDGAVLALHFAGDTHGDLGPCG